MERDKIHPVKLFAGYLLASLFNPGHIVRLCRKMYTVFTRELP